MQVTRKACCITDCLTPLFLYEPFSETVKSYNRLPDAVLSYVFCLILIIVTMKLKQYESQLQLLKVMWEKT